MNPQAEDATRGRTTSILLFLTGFGLFVFTRRSEIVPTLPVAIILAPIFILRFGRTLPSARGIVSTLFGFVLSMNIALWGLFEISDASVMVLLNVARSSLLAALYALPYAIDSLVYRRIPAKGLLSTLVFPTIVTAIFFLSSLEGPFDGTVGKSIYGYGPLVFQQLNSITGLWGFVFVYSWLAALINHAWENNFTWTTTRQTASVFAISIVLITSYGAIRMSPLLSRPANTVKVAAAILIPEDGKTISMEEIFRDKQVSPFDETLATIESIATEAALNDARIISFQELAITIVPQDEARLTSEYQRIASENAIYLSVTYSTFEEIGKGKNIHLLIDDQGKVQATYQKRFLVGFGQYGETGVFEKGPEVIQVVETSFGRIGLTICKDMNFQFYIRQAGMLGVDIMLSPSYDFPKSTSPSYYHRAIENGFSLVRPTYNGITYVEDFHGRVLGLMDSDASDDGILYADIPTRGVKTVYARFGDWLGWICVLGLICLSLVAARRREAAA